MTRLPGVEREPFAVIELSYFCNIDFTLTF